MGKRRGKSRALLSAVWFCSVQRLVIASFCREVLHFFPAILASMMSQLSVERPSVHIHVTRSVRWLVVGYLWFFYLFDRYRSIGTIWLFCFSGAGKCLQLPHATQKWSCAFVYETMTGSHCGYFGIDNDTRLARFCSFPWPAFSVHYGVCFFFPLFCLVSRQ